MFTTVEIECLRTLRFDVGPDIAVRRTGSLTYYIAPDASWRVIHHMNNIDIKGQGDAVLPAYRQAKNSFYRAMYACNSQQSRYRNAPQ